MDGVAAEYFLIQEQDRRKRLVLRRGAHVPIDSKRGQEPGDLRWPHLCRMPLVVKEDETPNPPDDEPFAVALQFAIAAVRGDR